MNVFLKRSRFLETCFLFSCLPFFSFLPVNSDTQPLYLLFLFLHVSLVQKFKLNGLFGLFLVSTVLIFLFDPSLPSSLISFYPGKSIALSSGLLLYITFTKNRSALSEKYLTAAVILYSVSALGLAFFPGFFIDLQSNFVRDLNISKVDPFSYRGLLPIATEPGLIAGLFVSLLIICEYFYFDQREISRKKYIFLFASLVFLVISTKSGTGAVYLCLYLSYFLLFRTTFSFKLTFFGVSLCVFFNVPEEYWTLLGRFSDVLSKIFVQQAILQDTSVFGRLLDFYAGLVSLAYSPLGAGITGLDYGTTITTSNSDVLANYYGYGSKIGLVSGFANLMVYGGWLNFILLAFVYFHSRAPLFAKLYSFLLLSFSFSAAFPMIWILLSLRRTSVISK